MVLMVGSFHSCTDPDLPELPNCQWTYNSQSVSFQPVALMHPSNAAQLDSYTNIYDMSGSIWCFAEIFGSEDPQKEGSQIKVTTSLPNCENNTSRTNLYNNSNYVGNITCANIGNLDRPENGTPKVTLEIKAGPHRNENWEEGYVVWTKTFNTTNGNPYVNQNATLTGSFIKNPSTGGGTASIGNQIYLDGRMITF